MANCMQEIFSRAGSVFLYSSLIIAASFLPASAQEEIPPELISDKITIISPADGSVVAPGQTILVEVQVAPGSPFTHIGVVGENIGFSEPKIIAQTIPPFVFSLVIPDNLIGPKKLTAVGIIEPGNGVFSQSITINIEPPASLTELRVSRTRIDFRFPGERAQLKVTGVFADGATLDITNSAGTNYRSENSAVAQVDTAGFVMAVGAGNTNIIASYGSRSAAVGVSVRQTIRGDLNGDGKVNRSDLSVLLSFLEVLVIDDWTNIPASKSKPAVGPFDARDLNGDGVINSDDVNIMVSLIGALADLSITLGVSPNPATVGSEVTYTLTVANNGPNDAPHVWVRGLIPKSQFVSSSIQQCGIMFDRASCNFQLLQRKKSITATIVGVPSEVGTFLNILTVGSGVPDPVITNDRASIQLSVVQGEPPPTSGRMSGRGYIDAGGKRYEFRFDVRLAATGAERGRLQLQVENLASGSGQGASQQTDQFVSRDISQISFSDSSNTAGQTQLAVDSVQFSGTGEWNGKPGFTFEAKATDVIKKGSGSDTFSITVKDPSGTIVATVSGTIASGDIRTFR